MHIYPVFRFTTRLFIHKTADQIYNSGIQFYSNLMGRKKTLVEVKALFEAHNYVLLATEYRDKSSRLEYLCQQGHRNSMSYNNFKYGKRCPTCSRLNQSKRQALDYDFVKQQFEERGCTLMSQLYLNYRQKLDFFCPFGHFQSRTYQDFSRNHICTECTKEKLRKQFAYDIEFVRNKFESEGCTLISKEYINNRHKLEFICQKGHQASATFGNFVRGMRCRQCFYGMKGKEHWRWNHDKSESERRLQRNYSEYRQWRLSVLKRDGFRCVICNEYGVVAHHLDGYLNFPEKRTLVENGATLCEPCHHKFHSLFGNGGNTKQQFEQYLHAKITT